MSLRSISRSARRLFLEVADIINDHITFELQCINRMYLNGYVPRLKTSAGAAFFIRQQFDSPMTFTSELEPITRRAIDTIKRFVADEELELTSFKKAEQKDDIAEAYLEQFDYGGDHVHGQGSGKGQSFQTCTKYDR